MMDVHAELEYETICPCLETWQGLKRVQHVSWGVGGVDTILHFSPDKSIPAVHNLLLAGQTAQSAVTPLLGSLYTIHERIVIYPWRKI